VDPAKVPDGGIYAICSECDRTFLVSRPEGGVAASDGVDLPEAPAFSEEELLLDETEDEISLEAPGDDEPDLELDEGDVFGFETEEEEEVTSDFALETSPEVEVEPAPSFEVEESQEIEAEAPPAPAEPEAPAPEPEPAEEAPPAAFEDLRGLASEAQSEGPSTHAGGSTLSEGARKFGKRDPSDRARRLARVLVSDIIAYYPERFQESRARGTVKDDFEAEVQKSWKEYVDQVGQEMAESTPYFTEALNEILAGGEEVF
jgi:outer membrane biosynthesis protein TonB